MQNCLGGRCTGSVLLPATVLGSTGCGVNLEECNCKRPVAALALADGEHGRHRIALRADEERRARPRQHLLLTKLHAQGGGGNDVSAA